MSIKPSFQSEVQLRRYSDTSSQGVQVVFALPDREALEPLIEKVGKRFMAVLVEIGDDEQPVQPAPRKDTRGPLCREAQDLCRMREFQEWASNKTGSDVCESAARSFILKYCDVVSRKDLDTQSAAGRNFINGIRLQFMRDRAKSNDMRAAAPSAAEHRSSNA